MASPASKKPKSLVALHKDFMANHSYDYLNPPQAPKPAQPIPQNLPGQLGNTDVVDTFNGLRQQAIPQGYKRPMVRRGMSGAELDANGQDPGSGMKWFDANNSPAQVDARNARQGVLDQRRGQQMQAAGSSAVAERQALQDMGQAPFQLQQAAHDANSVKSDSRGPNGESYMTMFDGKGNAVGTNLPPAQKPDWAGENALYGGGDLSSTNPKNPNLQQEIQQRFNQDAQRPRVDNKPLALNFLDSYATPGGSNASVVGAPASGTPVGGNVSPPRAGGINPVDFFGNIDTSKVPAPTQTDWASLLGNPGRPDISGFEEQIQQKQQSQQAPDPLAVPFNDPFVGAPYGGKLSAAQNEIMGLFAPKTTGSGMFGERQQTGQVRPGNTGPLDSVIPGMPGQLGWPMMQNKDVNSFAQFFPGMDWSADYGDASRSRIQQNFNDLIKQNAIRVGPDGNYQIIPQYPMEQLMKQY